MKKKSYKPIIRKKITAEVISSIASKIINTYMLHKQLEYCNKIGYYIIDPTYDGISILYDMCKYIFDGFTHNDLDGFEQFEHYAKIVALHILEFKDQYSIFGINFINTQKTGVLYYKDCRIFKGIVIYDNQVV